MAKKVYVQILIVKIIAMLEMHYISITNLPTQP